MFACLLVYVPGVHSKYEMDPHTLAWPDILWQPNEIISWTFTKTVYWAPRDNSFLAASTAQLQKKDSEMVKGLAQVIQDGESWEVYTEEWVESKKERNTSHRNCLREVTHSQETFYPTSPFSAARTYTRTYVFVS